MANPRLLKWKAPDRYTDGQPFGQADHGGYEVEVNGQSQFAIPLAWDADGFYEWPIVDLPGLAQGANKVRMRTVAASGTVSEWTQPVSFTYLSVPLPPTNLAVE